MTEDERFEEHGTELKSFELQLGFYSETKEVFYCPICNSKPQYSSDANCKAFHIYCGCGISTLNYYHDGAKCIDDWNKIVVNLLHWKENDPHPTPQVKQVEEEESGEPVRVPSKCEHKDWVVKEKVYCQACDEFLYDLPQEVKVGDVWKFKDNGDEYVVMGIEINFVNLNNTVDHFIHTTPLTVGDGYWFPKIDVRRFRECFGYIRTIMR